MHFLIILIASFCLTLSGHAKTTDKITLDQEKKPPVIGVLNRVIDGDTFVSNGQKIRLWGIDAPEKEDTYFFASKLYLETILESATFTCYYIDTDRYKRFVMRCYSGKDDIASYMVRMGLAKDYKQYSKGYYSDDELYAKENKYGMWQQEKQK